VGSIQPKRKSCRFAYLEQIFALSHEYHAALILFGECGGTKAIPKPLSQELKKWDKRVRGTVKWCNEWKGRWPFITPENGPDLLLLFGDQSSGFRFA